MVGRDYDGEDDEKPPKLRVVSDNPNARADRQIEWAKDEAHRAQSQFAAALLVQWRATIPKRSTSSVGWLSS